MEQKGAGRRLGLSLLGLLLFLLLMPLFLKMGGGKWLLAEVLPGQAAYGALSMQKPEEEQITFKEMDEGAVWGVNDVEFQEKKAISNSEKAFWITAEVLEKMKDFSYLKSNFYTVDARTALFESDINVDEALSKDFSIKPSMKEPKVLIFHTHTHEYFADSDMSQGLHEGICGIGTELKRILEEEYGISVLHDTTVYDAVNGVLQREGAYERSGPAVEEILKQNPSIEVCIDLHRDGIREDLHLVAEVDGKTTAQIMFVNGICRLNKDGQAEPVSWLENNYIKDNLAFSLQMKTLMGQEYPGLARRIYLNPYRFILHYMPRSALVEVGAQTNTKQEAMNAMKPLAKVMADVLLADTP